jgi:hypothetical protein
MATLPENDPAPPEMAPVPVLRLVPTRLPAVTDPVPTEILQFCVLIVVQVRAVSERAPADVKEATEAAPAVRVFAPAFRAPEDVKELTKVAPRVAAPAVRAPVPALIELLDVLMVVQVKAPEDVKEATEAAPPVKVPTTVNPPLAYNAPAYRPDPFTSSMYPG